MRILLYTVLISSVFFTGCDKKTTVENYNKLLNFGNLENCKNYNGLPQEWPKKPEAGMVKISGGTFQIGNNNSYPEERALYKSERKVTDFWIDATEVTNAQFQSFVGATSYVTEAEQQGEAAVFTPPEEQVSELAWWSLQKGAYWKRPWG